MTLNEQDMAGIRKVCEHLADDISKEIYADRLMCCITLDDFYWKKLRKYTDIARKLTSFSVRANGEGLVLFGGGDWIRNIFLLGGRCTHINVSLIIMKTGPWRE